jgi:RNA polymerase sigma factor (sigma-70 family)
MLVFSNRFNNKVIFVNLSVNCICNLPELIPRELLFSSPVKCNPKISPDGKKLAYLSLENNIMNLWIKSIERDDDRAITGFKKGCISYYIWTSDKCIFYIYDMYGNENHTLYKLNIENNASKALTTYKKLRVMDFDYHKDFPDKIIAAMALDDTINLYHIDLNSDTIELIYKNSGNIIYDWLIDNKRNLRGILVIKNEDHIEFMVKNSENSEWKTIVKWDMEDMLMVKSIRCSKDNNYIYMIDSCGCNTNRLVRIQINTGKKEIIVCDPEYDINTHINSYSDEFDPVLFDANTYDVQAVSINKFRKEWIILDETVKEDFTFIKKLKDGDFCITSSDRKGENWIIIFDLDKGPGSFYIFNRKLKKETFLFYDRPSLNDYTLASMEELSFTSRDGLSIHCYITFPPGITRKNLPVLLFVHGGPWSRDNWGYNPTVQWIANRGYVCLQVNYRGSSGYGKDFLNAGNKEWGGKMQNDLEDAVRCIIEKGIGDPHRIAIYGHGYGGYAAIAGAAFTPDLFCCAIAVGCPGDLITMLQSLPDYRKINSKSLLKQIGDPDTDRDMLISRSPFYQLDRIKIPLLIAYGLKNHKIKSSEPYRIVKTLKSKGIEVEHIVFPDEGHKIVRKKNRIKFYAIAEKFLAKHLKGRYESGEIHVKDIYIADSTHLDDRTVINKILREGDKYAFDKMMDYYEKPVLKHLYNMTGDYEISMELMQETFLRVWLYLDSYNFLNGISFASWLFKIATNVANNGMKKYKLNKELAVDEIDFSIKGNWKEDIEDKILIQSIVNSLEEPFKTAINLRYVGEFDYKDIASIMNTNIGQIKNYLFRGKKSILNSLMKSK